MTLAVSSLSLVPSLLSPAWGEPPRPPRPPRHPAVVERRAPLPRRPGAAPRCFYSHETPPAPCSGVPPRPEPLPPPRLVRVCNACRGDADCTDKPRGRCVVTDKRMCSGDGSRACAYPGDGCYLPGAPRSGDCAVCLNRGGRATCAPLPSMPPSAPPPRPSPGTPSPSSPPPSPPKGSGAPAHGADGR